MEFNEYVEKCSELHEAVAPLMNDQQPGVIIAVLMNIVIQTCELHKDPKVALKEIIRRIYMSPHLEGENY